MSEAKGIREFLGKIYQENYRLMKKRAEQILDAGKSRDIIQGVMIGILEKPGHYGLEEMSYEEALKYILQSIFYRALSEKKQQERREQLEELAELRREKAEETEGCMRLREVIGRLPRKEQEVIRLYCLDPRPTQEEMAERLGISRATVIRRYQRGKKLLRELLKEESIGNY